MLIKAAHKYKSPRQGRLTKKQAWVRRVAISLKSGGLQGAINRAAKDMAKLVKVGDVLVPIPSLTSGDIRPNFLLCEAIEEAFGMGLLTVPALDSYGICQGQTVRHRHGKPPYRVEDIPFISLVEPDSFPDDAWIYMVDNVVTSGNTLKAGALALGIPDARGLVWADARGTI